MAFEPRFELLKELCETPGVPSREEQLRSVAARELKALCDNVHMDTMGNVIGTKNGKGGPRVMLAAHIDEIGFIVSHIDDEGFIRLQPLGGWNPKTMVAQRVYVHGFAGQTLLGALQPSTKPIHLMTDADKNKPLEVDDFFVDVGLPGDEVKALVELGDMVTMARTCERVGNNIMSKAMDDRVSVFVMIEALRLLKELEVEMGGTESTILAVATVQEEVGLRGAVTSAYGLEPDVGIAIDVTLAMDLPEFPGRTHITKLGKGTAIKIMDGSLICHPKLVRHFRDIAESNNITHQLEILPRGGTDAGGIQRSRGGVPSFTLSIPTRYIHTVNEMSAWSDIQASIEILARYLLEAHTREYGYAGDLE
jgi:putative aminopeptidase FrvX